MRIWPGICDERDGPWSDELRTLRRPCGLRVLRYSNLENKTCFRCDGHDYSGRSWCKHSAPSNANGIRFVNHECYKYPTIQQGRPMITESGGQGPLPRPPIKRNLSFPRNISENRLPSSYHITLFPAPTGQLCLVARKNASKESRVVHCSVRRRVSPMPDRLRRLANWFCWPAYAKWRGSFSTVTKCHIPGKRLEPFHLWNPLALGIINLVCHPRTPKVRNKGIPKLSS